MFIEKEKIQRIIREHKISSFANKDETELANILYNTFIELGQVHQEKLATKDDIKTLVQMMDKRFEDMYRYLEKRFEAVDKRFEDMYRYMDKRFDSVDKRFRMMFIFMNIGFGIIILLTVLFKFLQ